MRRVVVAERICIPPFSEVVVPVKSDARGLCLVTTLGRRRVSVTNGLHQLEGDGIFVTKVANFSGSAVTLSPGMVIAQAEAHVENTIFNVEKDMPDEKDSGWKKLLDLEGLSEAHKIMVQKMLDKYAHLWDQNGWVYFMAPNTGSKSRATRYFNIHTERDLERAKPKRMRSIECCI